MNTPQQTDRVALGYDETYEKTLVALAAEDNPIAQDLDFAQVLPFSPEDVAQPVVVALPEVTDVPREAGAFKVASLTPMTFEPSPEAVAIAPKAAAFKAVPLKALTFAVPKKAVSILREAEPFTLPPLKALTFNTPQMKAVVVPHTQLPSAPFVLDALNSTKQASKPLPSADALYTEGDALMATLQSEFSGTC